MGITTSTSQSQPIQSYAYISGEAVGRSLVVWATKLGYNRMLLSLDDYYLVFGREIYADTRMASDAFHKTTTESGLVSALETFALLYLLGCPELSLDDKLDALISLVQFQGIPSPLPTQFSFVRPRALCSCSDLFAAVELVVTAFSRYTHTASPSAMICSTFVDTLFNVTKNNADDTSSSPIPSVVYTASWPSIRSKLDASPACVTYLRQFTPVTSLSDLKKSYTEMVASAAAMFRDRALAGQTLRGGRGSRGLGVGLGLGLGAGQSMAASKNNIFAHSPLVQQPIPSIRLSVSLNTLACLDLLSSSHWPIIALQPSERVELESILLHLGSHLTEDRFIHLMKAFLAHSLLLSSSSIVSDSPTRTGLPSTALDGRLVSSLFRILGSGDGEAEGKSDSIESLLTYMQEPAKKSLSPSSHRILKRVAFIKCRLDQFLVEEGADDKDNDHDAALKVLFMSLADEKGELRPDSEASLHQLFLSKVTTQSRLGTGIIKTASSSALYNEHLSFLSTLYQQQLIPTGSFLPSSSSRHLRWIDVQKASTFLDDLALKLEEYRASLALSDRMG